MNGLDRGWAHAISLSGALSMMLLVTLLPRVLTTSDGSPLGHGTLMLVMWGVSAGFVHGVGFIPRHPALRLLLGPRAAWVLLGFGLSFYVRHLSF